MNLRPSDIVSYCLFISLLYLSACSGDLMSELNPQTNPIERGADMLVPTKADGTALAKSFFMGFAGTWCWACGDYGAAAILAVQEGLENEEDALIMDVHIRDKLASPISNTFHEYFQTGKMPHFMINGHNIESYPVGIALRRISDFKASNPVAGLKVEYEVKGDSIYIRTKVQFFEEVNGTYTFNAYVLDYGSVHPQAGDDGSTFPDWTFEDGTYPEYIHEHILRASAHEEAFGVTINEDKANVGDTEYVEFVVPIHENWADKIKVYGTIWKKEGMEYQFVNAY